MEFLVHLMLLFKLRKAVQTQQKLSKKDRFTLLHDSAGAKTQDLPH